MLDGCSKRFLERSIRSKALMSPTGAPQVPGLGHRLQVPLWYICLVRQGDMIVVWTIHCFLARQQPAGLSLYLPTHATRLIPHLGCPSTGARECERGDLLALGPDFDWTNESYPIWGGSSAARGISAFCASCRSCPLLEGSLCQEFPDQWPQLLLSSGFLLKAARSLWDDTLTAWGNGTVA